PSSAPREGSCRDVRRLRRGEYRGLRRNPLARSDPAPDGKPAKDRTPEAREGVLASLPQETVAQMPDRLPARPPHPHMRQPNVEPGAQLANRELGTGNGQELTTC